MNSQERYYIALVDYLKLGLIDGSLSVNSLLPNSAVLAATLGYAESSIEDVLSAMETTGILSREPEGFRLTGDMSVCFTDAFALMLLMNRISFRDISRLRRTLELQALPAIVQNLSERAKNNLKLCLLRMKASERGDARADKQFHDLLIDASENQLLICIVHAMSQVLELQMSTLTASFPVQTWQQLAKSHETLYTVLCQSDLPAAKTALCTHYDLVDRELPANM